MQGRSYLEVSANMISWFHARHPLQDAVKRSKQNVSKFLRSIVPSNPVVFRLGIGALVVLSTVVIGLYSYANPDKFYEPVLLSISTSVISAYIFYLALIYFPRKRRLRIVLKQFAVDTDYFKTNIIRDLLQCSDSYDGEDQVAQQKDPEAFRRHFQVNVSSDQNRWHVVMNELQSNPEMYRTIIYKLEQFREEILYVLGNVKIDDPKVHRYFKIVAERIYKIVHDEHFGEEIKGLTGFLWEILANWSFIEGYHDQDMLQVMLQNISESIS